MLTLYHNPKCSKSRACLAFIENSGQQFELIQYVNEPLSYQQLQSILQKLALKPIDLIRKGETVWKERFEGKTLTDRQLIQAMIKFPVLMQRPIAVKDEKAVIARPLERIMEII